MWLNLTLDISDVKGSIRTATYAAERSVSHVLIEGGGVVVREKVEAALNKVRPSLKADGGDVELVEVTSDGVVKVKLTGACSGCPMGQMTLKMGIEKVIKEEVPDVKEVIAV